MKQILYDMGNFFLDHNQILRPYNYVISGLWLVYNWNLEWTVIKMLDLITVNFR